MMRRLHPTFACGSLTLAGTLDTAPGHTGLLMVSGGNEVRSGAFRGQAHLSSAIARAGFPVFRFDRRGIGDSEGDNRGFRSSERDIESALKAFRALAPDVGRVIAFGNCDAASALMLAGGAGCDGLVLANPWTFEEAEPGCDPLPAPAAVRNRYAAKIKDPAEIKRLLRGGVNLAKLAKGLWRAVSGGAPLGARLVEEMREGLATFQGDVAILLASADRTAQQFDHDWNSADPRIKRCDGAGHAFAKPEHARWLEERILAALRA